jgi:PAS domain S-box-containing protein
MGLNLILLVLELWLLGGVVVGLHRLGPGYGLSLMLAFLGGLGGLAQFVSTFDIFIQLAPGLGLGLASTLFIPVLLFGIVILCGVNGIAPVRLAVYVILGVTLLNLIVISGRLLHVALPGGGNLANLLPDNPVFALNARAIVAVLAAFLADVYLIALVYAAAGRRRAPMWLAAGLALLAGLWADALLVLLLGFAGTPRLAELWPGQLVGKTASALLLWPLAAVYVARAHPHPPELAAAQPGQLFELLFGAFGRIELALARSEARQQRLNRMLCAVSEINQLMVREHNRERLLAAACDALSRLRGDLFVWIGLVEADGMTMRLAAASGPANPERFTFRLDDPDRGPGCARAALRARAPFRVEPARDGDACSDCPLRARYPRRSAVALPIARAGRDLGIFVVHAAEPNVFDAEEVTLLQELADDLAFALEKLEADAELQRRARHLALLNDITRAALETPDLPAMLQTLADRLGGLLDADGCRLSLWDEARRRVTSTLACGSLRQAPRPLSPEADVRGLIEVMLDTGRPFVAGEVRTMSDEERRLAAQFPARFGVGLPLIAGDQKLGAIFLAFDQPRAFTPDEVARGEQAAGQAALAVAKARLLESERRQLRLARTLQEVGALLTTHMSLDEIFERLFDLLAEVINYDSASVQLLDEDAGRLYLAAGRGFADMERARYFTAHELSVETFTQRWTGASPRVMVIPDTHNDARWIIELTTANIRSWIGAALFVKGTFIGVLNVDSATVNAYDAVLAEPVAAFANQAAVAIENARLYANLQTQAAELARLFAETRRREMELTTLLEVSRTVSSSLALKEVLKQVATSMARIVGVDYCALSDYDPAGRVVHSLVLYASHGESDESVDAGRSYRLADYPATARVLDEGEPLIVRAAGPAADPAEAALLRELKLPVLLMIPLCVGGRAVGLAELYARDERREFTPGDVRLGRALADQAAVALENARLFETLEHREKHFRALIENASDGIAILDAGGTIYYQSPSVERILGHQPEDLVGQNVFRFLHPEDVPRAKSAFAEAIQTPGAIRSLAYRVRHRDGSWRTVEGSGHNLLGDPRVAGVVLNYRDVTERRRAEEALRLQNEYLAALQETTLELVSRLDLDSLLENIASRACALVGTPHCNLMLLEPGETEMTMRVATGVETRFTDLRSRRGEGIIGRTWATGQPIVVDDYRRWEGRRPEPAFDLLRAVVGVPIFSGSAVVGVLSLDYLEEGRTFGPREVEILLRLAQLASVALDNARLYSAAQQEVAERTRAEEALRRRTAELEALTHVAAALRAAHSRAEIQTLALDQALSLLRVEAGAILYPESGARTLQVAEARGVSFNWQAVLLRLEGSLRQIATGLLDRSGERPSGAGEAAPSPPDSSLTTLAAPLRFEEAIIGVLAVASSRPFADEDRRLLKAIAEMAGTALHRAGALETLEQRVAERTRDLAEANERLKELDRLKDQFIANVTHDLRTPLTNISLNLGLLAKRQNTDELNRRLPVLQRETRRLSRLIEDLLTLSRLEQGRVTFVREPYVLDSLFAEVLAAHAARAEAKGLTVLHEPNADNPAVPIDYAAMMQVFTNLIGNALAYTPSGGRIECRVAPDASQPPAQLVATIHNTGPSIPPEDLPHLFERFYRGRTGQESGEPGTGLGLAICREIVDRHGGQIVVESREGEGTTFRVYLPLA